MKLMLCCLLSFLLMMSFGTAANTTMKKTQEYTTAYLIKFFNDINSSSTSYIKNNTQYLIKHKVTGMYLCNNSDDNLTWSSTATSNCIFNTEITGQYFFIRTNNSYLSISQSNNTDIAVLVSSNSNDKIPLKIIYDENGSYKIFYYGPVSSKYTGNASFERVIGYASRCPMGYIFSATNGCYMEFIEIQ